MFKELSDDQYALGRKSLKAAQEAKTFREAIDSVKDAVSTGWMNTFEIIFGDYLKAKVLWTDLANALYDVFAAGGEIRNEILSSALGKTFSGLKDSIVGIMDPIKKTSDGIKETVKTLQDYEAIE